MKVKKYYSVSPYEAFKQIRTDLGGDAMILYSQKVRQAGWLGYLKKPVYEVGAAIDVPEPEVAATAQELPVEGSDDSEITTPDVLSIQGLLASTRQESKRIPQDLAPENSEDDGGQAPVPQDFGAASKRLAVTGGDGAQRIRRSTPFKDIEQQLLYAGLDAGLLKEILGDLPSELSRKALQSYATVSWAARAKLERSLPVLAAEFPVKADPAVIFLVGPTGVGKTTTIAKLAARFAFQRGRRVFLTTIDTRRVGAIPQLRAYAEILDIPLEVIYSPSDLERTLAPRARGDLTLIDTSGIDRKNPEGSADFARFVEAAGNPIVFLVLSAASRDEDVSRIVEGLRAIPIHGLVVTKIDETERLGTVYNVAWRAAKPLAYLSMGQNVPDDLEPANASAIADRLLGAKVER